jgi:hypothetical protein
MLNRIEALNRLVQAKKASVCNINLQTEALTSLYYKDVTEAGILSQEGLQTYTALLC